MARKKFENLNCIKIQLTVDIETADTINETMQKIVNKIAENNECTATIKEIKVISNFMDF